MIQVTRDIFTAHLGIGACALAMLGACAVPARSSVPRQVLSHPAPESRRPPSVAVADVAPRRVGGEIAMGMKVVAVADAESLSIFQMGTVIAMEGSTITIQNDPRAEHEGTTIAERSRVWAVGLPPESPVVEGEVLLCSGPAGYTRWQVSACRVVNAQRRVHSCEDAWGFWHECEATELTRPDIATQDHLERYLERMAGARRFRAAAIASGKPLLPTGWKPTVGARILVNQATTGDWSQGTIKSIRKDEIVVSGLYTWDVQVDTERIVPVPTKPQKAAVGQFVLMQCANACCEYGQVAEVQGDSFVVVDEYNERRTASGRDVVPIVR